MKFLIVMALSLATITQSIACVGRDGHGYLPKNDLNIGPDMGLIQGIDQNEFNSVLDKVSTIYASEVARFGGTLKIVRKWTDGTVNAMAHREGTDYVIEMFGGLARHTSITKDAFALVACHEIGHHIGGAPLYTSSGMTWASTEGQSDYFATTKCLRKVFSNENNQQIVSTMKIDSKVERDCNAKHTDPNEQAICQRISMAGLAGASMFAVIQNRPMPKFDTPDTSIVGQTYESHPQYQCRLDTYFNGAVCDASPDEDFAATDPTVGACNRSATMNYGFRPECWYRAPGSAGPNPNPDPNTGGAAKTPTVNGKTTINANNPNVIIPIQVDVSNFSGAKMMGFEISKPNQAFANPNGTSHDPVNGHLVQIFQQTKGTYNLLAAQQLPGWGTYQIRVISLDANRMPISKNSNSFILNLMP